MWWAKDGPGTGIEPHIDRLRSEGWSEDALELERAEAARLAEPGRIWPECWAAANVFLACRWELLPNFGGPPVWLGIAAAEIEAACRLHRIPPRERTEVSTLVRAMASAARPVLNEPKT